MSQARCRRSAWWWWGACGAWALAGPVMAADISQAREVAPPPGDRGELLYELPIAPVATSKPSAPPTVRSPAPVVSPASNAKAPLARDDSRTTAPGVPPGRTAARPVDKPAVGVVRRPASEAANTPNRTGRLAGTTEKRTPRLGEPPRRAAVRGARSADVPRETPARERQRTQAKPGVAEPVRPAQKGPSEPASPARPHLAWPGYVGAHGQVFHVEHRQSAPPAPRRDAVVRPSEACAFRSCRQGARCGWVCSRPRMQDDGPRPPQACRQGERPCAPAARQARWCANRLAPEAPWHSMPAIPQGRDCVPSVARRAWTWPPVRSATRTTTPRGRLAAVPLHGPD